MDTCSTITILHQVIEAHPDTLQVIYETDVSIMVKHLETQIITIWNYTPKWDMFCISPPTKG